MASIRPLPHHCHTSGMTSERFIHTNQDDRLGLRRRRGSSMAESRCMPNWCFVALSCPPLCESAPADPCVCVHVCECLVVPLQTRISVVHIARCDYLAGLRVSSHCCAPDSFIAIHIRVSSVGTYRVPIKQARGSIVLARAKSRSR